MEDHKLYLLNKKLYLYKNIKFNFKFYYLTCGENQNYF